MNPQELAALGPLVEAGGSVGPFNADGTVNVAIIRPCTSRGRRLKGLPPIYTQEMLAEEADAFSNWRMYLGHLTPEMAQAMHKAGRSIEDLGGRVTESWWNPDYTTAEDSARGFKPGAVMGKVIPYPAVRQLLEADPQALAVSINAWPKGASPGVDSSGQRGMVIEGFRRDPQGSVDWVISAGAGGGVVSEERAVSLLEAIYDPANDRGGESVDPKLSEMSEDEFRAHVAAQAPHLVEALSDSTRSDALEARLAALEERAEAAESRLAEAVDERANELLDEREKQRGFAERARAKITSAEGLTEGHRTDLLARYSMIDGKPAAGLLVESAEKLDDAVKGDVDHAIELIRESRPGARVSGLGDGDTGESGAKPAAKPGGWAGHLQEMGVMPVDDDGKPDVSKLLDGSVN